MTGVPPPERSMCHRSFSPPGVHLSGNPFSSEVPSCCGPRQSSHPRTSARADGVAPARITARATTFVGNPLILQPLYVRSITESTSSNVQADQLAFMASAIEEAVREYGVRPAGPSQRLRLCELVVPVRRGGDYKKLASLGQDDQLAIGGDQAALAHGAALGPALGACAGIQTAQAAIVITEKCSAYEYAAIEVVLHVAVFPQHLRPAAANAHKCAAVPIARGKEHCAAYRNRVRGIYAVACLPPVLPVLPACSRIERDGARRHKQRHCRLAALAVRHRRRVTCLTAA